MKNMHYYEVAVASGQYHGFEPLTYQSDTPLRRGQVVLVPLRKKQVAAIVIGTTGKPPYPTKPIDRIATELPLPLANLSLLEWLQKYYPAPLGLITQLFLPPALLRETYRTTVTTNKPAAAAPLPPLIPEQQKVVKTILDTTGSCLLHGDTGTGKTRIYQELASKSLEAGRSAIILTPEIGLTPQLTASFQAAFPGKVVVTHSNLTDAERRTIWLDILGADSPRIVIGPRSALFMPLKDIGLIVMDEAHEASYKQDSAPYYQTARVASRLAGLHKAQFVMGTATPLVSEYYLAEAKHLPILRMTAKPVQTQSSDIDLHIIDLKNRSSFARQPHLSDTLLEHIKIAMNNQGQALVFLNRRGTARLVLCSDCSWQALCPRCDIPLTYHADSHLMQCHTCGFSDKTPAFCPACQSVNILFKSIGTKAIVEELKKEFPRARIKRFDTDNTKAERLEQQFDDVRSGNVDIMVGTQILAKGLDLPNLEVVGVVAADTALYFPDYSAEERTYQLLSQVIGRVGRGHKHGTAIVQTYHPDSTALQAVTNKDWHAFYNQQLSERKAYRFPPFCHVLKLTCERSTQKGAMTAAAQLANTLRNQSKHIEVVGPSPSFHEKVRGRYRWQLIIKASNRAELTSIATTVPSGWTYDLDPNHLL